MEGCVQSGVGVRSYQSIFGNLKSPKYLIREFDWFTGFIDFSSSMKLV